MLQRFWSMFAESIPIWCGYLNGIHQTNVQFSEKHRTVWRSISSIYSVECCVRICMFYVGTRLMLMLCLCVIRDTSQWRVELVRYVCYSGARIIINVLHTGIDTLSIYGKSKTKLILPTKRQFWHGIKVAWIPENFHFISPLALT